MSIKQELQNALSVAMKAKDEISKQTIRLVLSSIKLAEVEAGSEIDNARILTILQKEVKTREDAIEDAKMAQREDLIEKAKSEIKILNRFLPQQMDEDELKALAKEIINETGATSMRDMGKIMKIMIPRLEGRASAQDASKVVRELLQN
jgi:uncharacterized protein YqeY